MATTPYLTREQFRTAVRDLLERARAEARMEDLERVVAYVDGRPPNVSWLASLMVLLDESYRTTLQEKIDAWRRHARQKGATISDEDVVETLQRVYRDFMGEDS